MKKCLALLPVLFFFQLCFGQYVPLIAEDKLWVESYSVQELGSTFGPSETWYYLYFSGDSTLNGTTYNKLYYQQFYESYWDTQTAELIVNDDLQSPIIHLLREDTDERKIFRRSNEMDELLLDFSLEEGDSLAIDGAGGSYICLDSITDLQLADGSIRNKFWFNGADGNARLIEGVGAENGLLHPIWALLLSGYQDQGALICFTEADVDLYGTCEFPNYSGISNKAISKSPDFLLYPNPAQEMAFLNLREEQKEVRIKAWNTNGRLCLEKQYAHVRVCELSLNGLSPGMYFLTIQEADGEIHNLRLIKQ
ncbi:MAG: T9SS type A sorting domain-containing protein [Bacteroidetes bacterium]|nr:T9SS type A sorting domain-containing protein [Bacteroidota bacterium]